MTAQSIDLVERFPDPETYCRLRVAAGLSPKTLEAARRGLPNTLHGVSLLRGDEVVGIFLSHELSGTCQCARLAADMANVDNVLFVDSESVCLGESLLVRLAVQLRDAGKTAGQIAATLEHAKEHLHLVAVIDDLKYLR